jgi:hypothetical protein
MLLQEKSIPHLASSEAPPPPRFLCLSQSIIQATISIESIRFQTNVRAGTATASEIESGSIQIDQKSSTNIPMFSKRQALQK